MIKVVIQQIIPFNQKKVVMNIILKVIAQLKKEEVVLLKENAKMPK